MSRVTSLTPIITKGAISGVVGGLLYGWAMRQLGMFSSVSSLIDTQNEVAGFALHMAIAVLVGVIFAGLMSHQRSGPSEMLYWGVAYGALWWFIGPLTLVPVILTGQLDWSLAAAHAQLPNLLGHFIFGLGMAISLFWLTVDGTESETHLTMGVLTRGILAGLIGAGIVLMLIERYSFPLELTYGSAAFAGILYALLDPRIEEGAGAGLIKGMLFGFTAWVVVGMTLLPAALGEGLPWSPDGIESALPDLIAYLLFGGILGWSFHVMSKMAGPLNSECPRTFHEDGIGTRGFRIVVWGGAAGLFGGLLFAALMTQTEDLRSVAELIAARDVMTGLGLHLVIALLIGISYGALFRGRAYDAGSALSWGISYGFVWWILGSLTLRALLLGTEPNWSPDYMAQQFAILIGHLVYGAGLGMIYHAFEARHNPWWIARSDLEAERMQFRVEQTRTSAPALWTLVVIIALLLPILLA